jgi:NadR type nicotinamide-nucleotide adenylyltransferase
MVPSGAKYKKKSPFGLMIKIAIVGPENAGKSVLTQELAAHFQAPFAAEFARAFLEENGTAYSYDTLLTIAKGQWQGQQTAVVQAQKTACPIVFWDTDMLVMKVWCEFVYQNCHAFILEKLAAEPADFYLLCQSNLPWVDDGLREYPDETIRQNLYHIYKSFLVEQQIPFAEVDAVGTQRLAQAITACQHFLGSKS